MNIRKSLQMVREFQKGSGQKLNNQPTLIEAKEFELRFNLMLEENREYRDANIFEKDIVEVLDACVDMAYILFGTINAHGLQDKFEKAFQLVHENNMTKIGPDGKVTRDPDGKILKPEGFQPVDLKYLFSYQELARIEKMKK